MGTGRLSADYLVIGSGAAGMAFTDALVTHSNAEVILVDRRHAPGGHWNDAYSFVRLHQPSAFYGVDSLPLGNDTVDTVGANRGGYERATASEICGYYQRVLDTRLLASGRVRYFPMCEYLGEGRFVSRVTGAEHEVHVRGKEVDGRYLEPIIPATMPPPFEVGPEVRCVPVNALAHLEQPPGRYAIIGAGKTAMDAVFWLLEQGTDPDAITWVKPREGWLTNRDRFQPLTMVDGTVEAGSLYAEVAAHASSLDEYFALLSEQALLLRVDENVAPTMAKAPTMNPFELSELRRVAHVVRLGHVRRIEGEAIVLDQGTIPTRPDHVHVHCAGSGVPPRPTLPVFDERRITLQPLRLGLPCLGAAVTGFLEATRDDPDEKNRLCPPHSYPDEPVDFARLMLHTMKADYAWSSDPDVDAYVYGSRLNPVRGWRERLGEPRLQAAAKRYVDNVVPALANLDRLTSRDPSGDRSGRSLSAHP